MIFFSEKHVQVHVHVFCRNKSGTFLYRFYAISKPCINSGILNKCQSEPWFIEVINWTSQSDIQPRTGRPGILDSSLSPRTLRNKEILPGCTYKVIDISFKTGCILIHGSSHFLIL